MLSYDVINDTQINIDDIDDFNYDNVDIWVIMPNFMTFDDLMMISQ